MSRFIVTLPSNSSMDYYDGNAVANFTTKLAHLIELDGKWEVGLSTIIVPAEVENVIRGDCYYKVYHHNRLRCTVVMQPGYYHMIPAVVYELHAAKVREIERETGSDIQPLVRLIINCTTKSIKMVYPEVEKEHIHVDFSIDGIHVGFQSRREIRGNRRPDVRKKIRSDEQSEYVLRLQRRRRAVSGWPRHQSSTTSHRGQDRKKQNAWPIAHSTLYSTCPCRRCASTPSRLSLPRTREC